MGSAAKEGWDNVVSMDDRPTKPSRQDDEVLAEAYHSMVTLSEGLLHDARNPLNALSINLEVLQEKLRASADGLTESQEKNLRAMRNQVDRMEGIFRRFGAFLTPSRAGDVADLAALTTDALEVMGHEARRRRVSLKSAGPEQVPCETRDGPALRMVVTQLVHSVLQQAEPEDTVTVRLEEGPRPGLLIEGTRAPPSKRVIECCAALISRAGGSVTFEPRTWRLELPGG